MHAADGAASDSDADPGLAQGQAGELIRDSGWSQTPLGPVERWPRALAAVIGGISGSSAPTLVWWGPELTTLYNDACSTFLGARHPQALGRPGPQLGADLWSLAGPLVERVQATGQASAGEALPIMVERAGVAEERYLTLSCSPILGDAGAVAGVCCGFADETRRVLAERRLGTVRALAEQPAETAEAACAGAAKALSTNPHDLPFALLYLLDTTGEHAVLAGAAGLTTVTAASPRRIVLAEAVAAAGPWPLGAASTSHQPQLVTGLRSRFTDLPGSTGPDQALILPIARPGQGQLAGFVVAGISPLRAFDDDYREFLTLITAQMATTIAGANSRAEARALAAALLESEARLTLALQAAHMVAWEWDLPQNRVVATGPPSREISSPPVMTTAEDGFQYIHPDDRERHMALVGRALGQRGLYTSVFRTIHPDTGQTFWVEEWAFAEADEAGAVRRMIGVTMDITAHKIAEAERETLVSQLAGERQRFDAIMERVPAGVVITRPDGSLIFSNQEVERILEASLLPASDIADYGSWPIFDPETREPLAVERLPLARTLLFGETVEGEVLLLRRHDGEERSIIVNAAPVRDTTGAISCGVATFVDITEQVRRVAALHDQERQLRSPHEPQEQGRQRRRGGDK